jgi:hypothetical protein
VGGFTPFAPQYFPLSGGTISGPVTITGALTTQDGIGNSGAAVVSATSMQANSTLYINHGSNTESSAPVLTPAFANGTAAQLSDTARDYMVYLTCSTAGTGFSLAIGPTATPANSLVSDLAVAVGEQYSFRLPAGWYVEWSATSAAFADQIAIGC